MEDKYYTEVINENGEIQTINTRTGEVVEIVSVCVPVGTRLYTPEEQKTYRKRHELEQQKNYRRAANADLGKHFFFGLVDEGISGITPQSASRLIYLMTFLEYDSGRLMKKKSPIKKSNLRDMLNISKPSTLEFWKEVSPKYLSVDNDSCIIANTDFFKRGRLSRCTEYTQFQKFFCESIQKIYESCDSSRHRYLGYIYKMVPHINYEFNVLCRNPHETDVDSIEYISFVEFCEMIGYDPGNFSRLADIYKNLTFDVGGKQERFCAFVYDCVNKKNARILVNPRIMYNGSDYRHVEILGSFCS